MPFLLHRLYFFKGVEERTVGGMWYADPCIRLGRLKFELINQGLPGGKKVAAHWVTFLTGDGIKYLRKRIYNPQNHTRW